MRKQKNGQANFDAKGAPYAKYENGIVVLWDRKWTLFVTHDEYMDKYIYRYTERTKHFRVQS